MLCYRCGRHTPDGSANCANCGQPLATKSTPPEKPRRGLEPAVAGPFAPGQQIALRYVVKAFLGQGPSGYVYRVVDPSPRGGGRDAELALKVFHSRLLQTSEDKKELHAAVDGLNKINYTGINRVFDYGEDGARIFISQQLCHGLPLSRIIELRSQDRLFSLAECEPIFSQICTALEQLHQHMAHGALKPQNIMVQPDDIRLLDAGLMAGLPRRPYLSGFGPALGYVAPEVQRESPDDIEVSADIFALGAMLREMLTGEKRGAATQRPAPPVLPAARGLLDRALHVDPKKRLPDAKTFRDLLQAAVEEPERELFAAARGLDDPLMDYGTQTKIDIDPPPTKRRLTVVPPLEAPTFSVGGKPVPKPKPPTPSVPSGPVIINFGGRAAVAESRSLPMALGIIALGLIAATIVIWTRNPALFSMLRPSPTFAPADISPTLPPPAPSAPAFVPVDSHTAPPSKEPAHGLQPTREMHFGKETRREELHREEAKREEGAHRAGGGTSCPSGMVFVGTGKLNAGSASSDEYHNFSDRNLMSVEVGAFCIDRYEYPNGAGTLPTTNITYAQAKQMCTARGRRLCEENEWERACKGPQNSRFAYGDEFSPTTCNVQTPDGAPRPVQGAGQAPECKSAFGVIDMSGNAGEWTESRLGEAYIVKGGDAGHADFASRCANRSAMSPHSHSSLVGTRCCTDPD